jgi:hypothetical protein
MNKICVYAGRFQPFTPAAGFAYKFVVVGVWNQYEQLIADKTLIYVL